MPDSKSANAVVEKMSRHDMLEWVNATVHGQYKKIEELCSGVAYCLMMELLFPQCIGLKKVKMNAKLEHEFLHNLKHVQSAFTRLNIDKAVPIDRLLKGRFQDNFEFLQWFKKFFDTHAAGKENMKVPAALAAAAVNAPKPVTRKVVVVNAFVKPETLVDNKTSVSPTSLRVLQDTKKQLIAKLVTIENDRDEYYEKLRTIEDLLNDAVAKKEHVEWCERALRILYVADNTAEIIDEVY